MTNVDKGREGVQKFSFSLKKHTFIRSEVFHKMCVQGKESYTDRSSYAHERSLSD